MDPKSMTEAVTQARAPKHVRSRLVPDDVVSPNGLATHLGMTRQNVARLTAEAVLVQRSAGCYDQTANRLRYIKHLRTSRPHSPRTEADAPHVVADPVVAPDTASPRLLKPVERRLACPRTGSWRR
jgi:hypothetical protein